MEDKISNTSRASAPKKLRNIKGRVKINPNMTPSNKFIESETKTKHCIKDDEMCKQNNDFVAFALQTRLTIW